MHRTTLILDQPLLLEIKEIARKEKKTLKKVICELLNTGLQTRKMKKYSLRELCVLSECSERAVQLSLLSPLYSCSPESSAIFFII